MLVQLDREFPKPFDMQGLNSIIRRMDYNEGFNFWETDSHPFSLKFFNSSTTILDTQGKFQSYRKNSADFTGKTGNA